MKKRFQRIISSVLCLAIIVSFTVFPASATPGAAVDYVSGQLWDLMQLQDIDTGLSFWKNLVKKYLAPGVTESTATAADWAAAYGGGSSGGGGAGRDGSYINDIYTNYGSSILNNLGGWYLVPKIKSVKLHDFGSGSYFPFSSPSGFVFNVSCTPTSDASRGYSEFVVSLDCSHFPSAPGTLFLPIALSSNNVDSHPGSSTFVGIKTYKGTVRAVDHLYLFSSSVATESIYVKGGSSVLLGSGWHPDLVNPLEISGSLGERPFSANTSCTLSANIDFLTRTFYFVPTTPSPVFSDCNTRFGGGFGGGSSSGGGAGRDLPYIGKKDDTGKLTAVSGAVFDEKAGTYMNPFDGVVKNVKSWTYDYTTRAYTLTLADDSTVVLTYGDDNVIIVEGGKTYTFYYLIPAAVTPSPSPSVPPVSPSPSVPPVSPPPSPTVPGGGLFPDIPNPTPDGKPFTLLSIIKSILDGLWKLVTGFVSTILIPVFTSIPSAIAGFFDAFKGDGGILGWSDLGLVTSSIAFFHFLRSMFDSFPFEVRLLVSGTFGLFLVLGVLRKMKE